MGSEPVTHEGIDIAAAITAADPWSWMKKGTVLPAAPVEPPPSSTYKQPCAPNSAEHPTTVTGAGSINQTRSLWKTKLSNVVLAYAKFYDEELYEWLLKMHAATAEVWILVYEVMRKQFKLPQHSSLSAAEWRWLCGEGGGQAPALRVATDTFIAPPIPIKWDKVTSALIGDSGMQLYRRDAENNNANGPKGLSVQAREADFHYASCKSKSGATLEFYIAEMETALRKNWIGRNQALDAVDSWGDLGVLAIWYNFNDLVDQWRKLQIPWTTT